MNYYARLIRAKPKMTTNKPIQYVKDGNEPVLKHWKRLANIMAVEAMG